MKKMSTQLENQLDWLKNEIEKDNLTLQNEKLKLIKEIKKIKKEDLLPKVEETKKLTIWEKLKKVIIRS
jgi:hypothetical protein